MRHTFGTRLSSVASAGQSLDYNAEVIGQTGTFNSSAERKGNIRAYSLGGSVGYTSQNVRLKPRFGVAAAVVSGDRNRNDPDLQHFNSLFPKATYFGLVNQNGPLNNVRGLEPNVTLGFSESLSARFGTYFFWRDSTDDGLYGIPGNLIRTGAQTRARYIGTQPNVELTWQATPHLTVQGFYAYFFTGRFLRETPPGNDIGYAALQVSYKF